VKKEILTGKDKTSELTHSKDKVNCLGGKKLRVIECTRFLENGINGAH
jgi:hypothetical protein